ncbi:MAG: aminotransferase class IV [Bacteroidales bacterium]
MNFIETIKVEDGLVKNLDLHIERAKATAMKFFGVEKEYEFGGLLSEAELRRATGVYKLRVIYSKEILGFSFEPYKMREIHTLRPVDGSGVDYYFKYESRGAIEALFEQRGDCDDILIIKDGYVTDTSYCNFICSDGKGLYTPSTPLLKGTKREQLLREWVIKERDIRIEDLKKFSEFYLINAMFGPHRVTISPF